MTPRSMWKGVISLGMLTIPVKLYKATDDRGGIEMHKLHTCGQRIQMPNACPEHGIVPAGEVVKGFEFAPETWVTLSTDELDSLKLTSLRQLAIDGFVPQEHIGFPKSTYYVAPEPVGGKAFALLRDTMLQQNVQGVTRIAFRDRESLAVLESANEIMTLTTVYWPDEVRSAADLAVPAPAANKAESDMARRLVRSMTGQFDPAKYHDAYGAALKSLIEDKIAGRTPELPSTPPTAAAPDLLSVLAASIEKKPRKKAA